jgi:hypothetical protein
MILEPYKYESRVSHWVNVVIKFLEQWEYFYTSRLFSISFGISLIWNLMQFICFLQMPF